MTRLLQLLLSVVKRRATAKPLTRLMKSFAVALLQRFRRVLAGNFNLRPAVELKLPGTTSGKQRNSATVGVFTNIINNLSVALHFATERNSRNRELG